MPLSNSRFMPLAFWAGFLALGLATNLGPAQKANGRANGKQRVSLASATGKQAPLLLIQNPGATLLRY